MTRIETALARMVRNPDVFHPNIDQRAASMLATPVGAALTALVEAAEAEREYERTNDPLHPAEYRSLSDRRRAAVDAWLAATEETPDAR